MYGPNELSRIARVTAGHTLLARFKNVLIVILLAATILSALVGHVLEAVVISVIVLFAVLLGFIQEYRAERALEALRRMAAPRARVVRDDRETRVATQDVVPGDIVALRVGDRVPADARLTLAVNLASDEASLTGEAKIEAWRLDYNQHRPPSSLGHLTPNEFAAQRQITRTVETSPVQLRPVS